MGELFAVVSKQETKFYLFVHENLPENSEEPTSHSMIKKKLFDRKLSVNAYSPVLQKIFDEWLLNLN